VTAITARGLTFEVRVEGPADGETVLLLHGFPQHGGMWDGVVPALHEAGLRTVAPDQRGYSPGARPTETIGYRMSECVADALAILDETADARPVHVVGHDWGAVVGWHLAALHPERLRTFTAVSVPHTSAVLAALETDLEQRDRGAYIRLFRDVPRALRVLLDDDARGLRGIFTGSGLPPGGVQRYVEPLADPQALAGALRWYEAMTLERPLTAAARVPTTFVWGSEDTAIGRHAAQRCGEFVAADYAYVPLEGVSHWVADQAPEPLVEAILKRVT
jgi:pimeloyl-ACP methyl ester carboxylesterase